MEWDPGISLIFTERISSTIRNRSRFFKVVHQFAIIIQISLFGILLLIIFGNLASCYDYFSYCMNTRPLAVFVNAIASGGAGVILGRWRQDITSKSY